MWRAFIVISYINEGVPIKKKWHPLDLAINDKNKIQNLFFIDIGRRQN